MVISEKTKPFLNGAIFGVVIGIIALACTYIEQESEKKVSKQEIETKIDGEDTRPEISSGNDVYVSDNVNDESSAIITESSTTVSYWYVYYNAHIEDGDTRYAGYEIISIPYPYFDVYEAIKVLVPKYKNGDFVGIEYFKRVPFETYKSFIENENEK